jgi:hypothetical protein
LGWASTRLPRTQGNAVSNHGADFGFGGRLGEGGDDLGLLCFTETNTTEAVALTTPLTVRIPVAGLALPTLFLGGQIRFRFRFRF